MSNPTSATCRTASAYPSGAHEITMPDFDGVRVAKF